MTVESNTGAAYGLASLGWTGVLKRTEVPTNVSQNAARYHARNLLAHGAHLEITPDLSAKTARVEVDPNQFAGPDTDTTVVRRSQFVRAPFVGEFVVAVQTDEDDEDFVGSAMVTEIDEEFDLVYLLVNWDEFRYEGSHTRAHAAGTLRVNSSPGDAWKVIHTTVKWSDRRLDATRHDSNPTFGRFRELSPQ